MVELFTFPAAPGPKATEWPGTPIGTGNAITEAKSPTAVRDNVIDRIEGRRDELVSAGVEHVVRRAGTGPVWIRDAIIHGVRVRLITDSPHLQEFWTANWYDPEGWRSLTELTPPYAPRIVVYALSGVADQPEAVYYSRRTDTIILFNTSYYDQLRGSVLGAVGHVLAEDYGIHTLRGACAAQRGRGVLYLGPTGIGKSTLAYGFLSRGADARVYSDDWVHVRYTLAMRDGRRIVPFEIRPTNGRVMRGHRVYRWLEEHRGASGQVRGLDLGSAEIEVPVAALDLAKPIEAYAYPAEKASYARTGLIAGVPRLAAGLLRARFENVPDVAPERLDTRAAELDNLADAVLRAAADAGEGAPWTVESELGASRDDVRRWLARLTAFDGARAILDVAASPLAGHVVTHPMEGIPVSALMLVRHDPLDRTILQALPVETFVARVLIGRAADGACEIAYNPDRAVDTAAERAAVERLEADVTPSDQGGQSFYREFRRQPAVPETLAQEFEFLRLLHQAARCYDLNAILALDPNVRDLPEAVARTAALTVYMMETSDRSARASLDDYRKILTAVAPPP